MFKNYTVVIVLLNRCFKVLGFKTIFLSSLHDQPKHFLVLGSNYFLMVRLKIISKIVHSVVIRSKVIAIAFYNNKLKQHVVISIFLIYNYTALKQTKNVFYRKAIVSFRK